jgi:hypothetical protein
MTEPPLVFGMTFERAERLLLRGLQTQPSVVLHRRDQAARGANRPVEYSALATAGEHPSRSVTEKSALN